MTDLLNRPRGGADSRRGRGHGAQRRPEPRSRLQPRSLATNAVLAGAGAALITLTVCMAVAVTGWFLADAGAHGDTPDALRVGAVAWLVGHGSGLVLSGTPLGVVPLALTAVLVLGAFRAGRWAGRTSVDDLPTGGSDGSTGAFVRLLAPALASYVLAYGVVLVVTWVLAGDPAAEPGLGRGLLGALLVSAFGGGCGLLAGTGGFEPLLRPVPRWLVTTAYGALVGALGVLAVSAAVLAVALALDLNEAATVVSGLHLGGGDAVTYALVIALVAPNCVLLATAYLLGPGFALGTGTAIAPTGVTLGAVPAFPVLAAIPAEGPAPEWLVGVTVLPGLVAAVAAGMAQRRSNSRAYDLGALRGAAAGVGAAVLLALAIALARGPLGTGRMADIGAPFFEVLVIASGGMGVGGMLGGVVATWWQRRRGT